MQAHPPLQSFNPDFSIEPSLAIHPCTYLNLCRLILLHQRQQDCPPEPLRPSMKRSAPDAGLEWDQHAFAWMLTFHLHLWFPFPPHCPKAPTGPKAAAAVEVKAMPPSTAADQKSPPNATPVNAANVLENYLCPISVAETAY